MNFNGVGVRRVYALRVILVGVGRVYALRVTLVGVGGYRLSLSGICDLESCMNPSQDVYT